MDHKSDRLPVISGKAMGIKNNTVYRCLMMAGLTVALFFFALSYRIVFETGNNNTLVEILPEGEPLGGGGVNQRQPGLDLRLSLLDGKHLPVPLLGGMGEYYCVSLGEAYVMEAEFSAGEEAAGGELIISLPENVTVYSMECSDIFMDMSKNGSVIKISFDSSGVGVSFSLGFVPKGSDYFAINCELRADSGESSVSSGIRMVIE